MTRIEHRIDIAAPVEWVWTLTEDIESWPDYSPTMNEIRKLDDGPLTVGSRARVKQPWQLPAVWTVTALEPPVLFEWSTRMGTVTIVAGHQLAATEEGCRQALVVDLAGAGSGLLGRLFGRRIAAAIAAENEGFKRQAEGT